MGEVYLGEDARLGSHKLGLATDHGWRSSIMIGKTLNYYPGSYTIVRVK